MVEEISSARTFGYNRFLTFSDKTHFAAGQLKF